MVKLLDSNYANDLDKRKSFTNYVFTLFGNTVSLKCNLQSIVALSITDVEYIACTEAVRKQCGSKDC